MEDALSYSIVRSYTKPYESEHIFDAADFARAVYSITKQRPSLLQDWYGKLSEYSTDWYEKGNIYL